MKEVARWVDWVATAAEKGGEMFYDTVFGTIGRQLYYLGLRQSRHSLVDDAQKKGKI